MRILVFLTLITTIFAFGCAEDMEEEMEEMVEETLTPLEKAQEAMQQVSQ
jgi:uncharacterized protein Yka (UPF0111/DUF47 family)